MKLTELDFGGNWLQTAGAALLAPALATMTSLTSLHLGHNNLRATGTTSLAPALSTMVKLTLLDMEYNDFGEAGAASLSPALGTMTSLTALFLGQTIWEQRGRHPWHPRLSNALGRVTASAMLDHADDHTPALHCASHETHEFAPAGTSLHPPPTYQSSLDESGVVWPCLDLLAGVAVH